MHVFPDLVRLEKKYPKHLVVIGVHSPKFDSEKESASIRKAMLRYELNHPTVNDANLEIAKAYQAMGWPTTYLIDPEGKLVGKMTAEKIFDVMDKALTQLIKVHKSRKTLVEELLPFQKETAAEKKTSPLFFPGKVLADAASNRLFITDSTHHRVVITALDGKKVAVAGTGKEGNKDGPFAKAQFSDPQGLALRGDTLYVADRKNHIIRALDLKTQTVKTVAGTGKQGTEKLRGGAGLKTALNSPWGLLVYGNTLYIGMAGHHQLWAMDLTKSNIFPFAGTGMEDLKDGSRGQCVFAQPSGLGTDGTYLYVADSESSAIRMTQLDGKSAVSTLVGKGLFVWGDKDGPWDEARLQHPLDVVAHKGKLYLTDTYNHKIKVLDPNSRTCTTLEVIQDGDTKGPAFDEPAGLSIAGDKLYVADTNAHRIRVVDLNTKKVSTLTLSGVELP